MSSCGQCDKYTIHQPFFVCYPLSPTYVTYRATLKGTSEMDSKSLVSLLGVWVSKRERIIVSGILMTVDSECSVVIHSLTEGECLMPSPSPHTTSTMTAPDPTVVFNTPMIVIGVLVPSVLLTLTCSISVVVIYIIRRKHRKIQ